MRHGGFARFVGILFAALLVFAAQSTVHAQPRVTTVPLEDMATKIISNTFKPQGWLNTAVSDDGRSVVFVSTPDSSLIHVNLATGQTRKTEGLGNRPQEVAITPNGARAYTLLYGDQSLVGTDLASLVTGAPIRFTERMSHASFALSGSGEYAYVLVGLAMLPPAVAFNQLEIVNLSNGVVERSIPLGRALGGGLPPSSKRVFAPRSSPYVFIADDYARAVQIVDPVAGQIVKTIPVPDTVSSLSVTDDGSKILVLSRGADVVYFLDANSGHTLWQSSTYPGSPGGAVIDPRTGFAYVTILSNTGELMQFDLTDGRSERRSFELRGFGEPGLQPGDGNIVIPVILSTPDPAVCDWQAVLLLDQTARQKSVTKRPSTPRGISAQAKNGQVTVSWKPGPVASQPAAEFFTVATRPKTTTYRSRTNTCVLARLTPGKKYTFVVTAHAGNQKSKSASSRPITVPR